MLLSNISPGRKGNTHIEARFKNYTYIVDDFSTIMLEFVVPLT